jgi:hypothetical protein
MRRSAKPHASGGRRAWDLTKPAVYRGMAKGWTFHSLIDAKMAVTAHCHHFCCNNS